MLEIIKNRKNEISLILISCLLFVKTFNVEIEVMNNQNDNIENIMNGVFGNPLMDTISKLMTGKFAN